MELTNREWSVLLWTVVILGFAFWKAKPWALLKSFVDILASKVIVIFFGSMALFVLGCVWLLWTAGFWTPQNLKTTIWWVLSFAIVSLVQVNNAQDEPDHFRRIWREVISANIFIAFIASTFVFSLLVELALVPLATLASLMLVLAERDPKAAPVRSFLNGLILILGAAILGNAVWQASHKLREIATVATAREFVVPVVLSLLYIPFLYCWHLFLTYQRAFGRITWSMAGENLIRLAKKRALIAFNADMNGLGQWLRHIAIFRPESEQDVVSSIAEIKRLRRRQRQPFRVPPADGWLPEDATAFLADEALSTNEYRRFYDGWYANAKPLELGSGPIPNNIAYYIEGDESAVRTLRLVLNVNNRDSEASAVASFNGMTSKLVNRAAYGPVGEGRTVQVTSEAPPIVVGKLSVSLSKEAYAIEANGYTLTLAIQT